MSVTAVLENISRRDRVKIAPLRSSIPDSTRGDRQAVS